jgi:hypothetical protein
MGRPADVAGLLQQGCSPAQIAGRLGISVGSVRQYLWVAIGEGLIRRSDVRFSISRTLRTAAEAAIQAFEPTSVSQLGARLHQAGIEHDREELQILWNLIVTRGGYGDLYEFVVETEQLLHSRIRDVLVQEFGAVETGWWRRGVPEKVRVSCVTAREQSEDNAEPYGFTTLLHLRDILDKQWALFSKRLPEETTRDKKQFMKDLEQLNAIRNRVMHPTRLRNIVDDDFEFAREMHRRLREEAWR